MQIVFCEYYVVTMNIIDKHYFGIAWEHAIRNIQENQKALELNGTHQLPVCANGGVSLWRRT
jgi:hypothetical protein